MSYFLLVTCFFFLFGVIPFMDPTVPVDPPPRDLIDLSSSLFQSRNVGAANPYYLLKGM